MDPTTYVIAILLVGLVICSAYFSASETAYSSLNIIRIKNLVYEGNKNAEKALQNYENFDKILTTILVGNNVVNTAASTICTALFTTLFGGLGVIYATIFMITVLLVFGEVTPKTLAKKNSERYALRFASSLQLITVIMTPIVWLFLRLTNLISKRAKNDSAESPTLTEDELYVMIDEIEEEGTLRKRESDLIKSAIEFDDIKVSEIYTPRVDVTALDVRSEVEDMKKIFLESEYSRIPVYDTTIDRIIGAVYAKDFYSKYIGGCKFELSEIIRPVKFVPENTSIATLLGDLQKTKIHMAVVLDNFGGTVGIVCLEDIIEELVGDIWDESDEVRYPVIKDEDGGYTVLGEANIFDVMSELELRFSPGDFTSHSVSGYIHHKLEKIPQKGDSVELDNVSIIVKSMKSRRIKEARFIPKPVSEIKSE